MVGNQQDTLEMQSLWIPFVFNLLVLVSILISQFGHVIIISSICDFNHLLRWVLSKVLWKCNHFRSYLCPESLALVGTQQDTLEVQSL